MSQGLAKLLDMIAAQPERAALLSQRYLALVAEIAVPSLRAEKLIALAELSATTAIPECQLLLEQALSLDPSNKRAHELQAALRRPSVSESAPSDATTQSHTASIQTASVRTATATPHSPGTVATLVPSAPQRSFAALKSELLGILEDADFAPGEDEPEASLSGRSRRAELPPEFWACFEAWFSEQQEDLLAGSATQLWELCQALWAEQADEGCALFLSRSGLAYYHCGFWGLYLDALIAAAYHRKGLYEVRRQLAEKDDLPWAMTAWRRLPILLRGLALRAFDWQPSEGAAVLRSRVAQPLPPLTGSV